jgi:hypothetical protein
VGVCKDKTHGNEKRLDIRVKPVLLKNGFIVSPMDLKVKLGF